MFFSVSFFKFSYFTDNVDCSPPFVEFLVCCDVRLYLILCDGKDAVNFTEDLQEMSEKGEDNSSNKMNAGQMREALKLKYLYKCQFYFVKIS